MKYPQPHIIPIGHKKYRLEEDFHFYLNEKNYAYIITIEKGFVYDGTSAPQILWTLTGITPDGIHRAASLVHDYLYHYEGNVPKGTFIVLDKRAMTCPYTRKKYTRKFADDFFLKMLKLYNKRNISNWSMYLFVRLFGWVKWK